MRRSNIVASFSSRRKNRARSCTVAAPECTRARPARAEHGGPAGTSCSSGLVAAAGRLGLQLRSATTAHEREGKNSVATLATARLAATEENAPRSSRHRSTPPKDRCPLPAVAVGSPARRVTSLKAEVSKTVLTYATAPNPSVKARPNGKPPGPGRRYAVHFRRPGPGVLPSVPPYLER